MIIKNWAYLAGMIGASDIGSKLSISISCSSVSVRSVITGGGGGGFYTKYDYLAS